MNDLKEFKKIFDPILKQYLDKKIDNFSKNVSDAFILDIVNYSQKLIETGGKRIRPFIAYLMYEALGGKDTQSALKLFTSLEIFHTFCLIHDDIIDKSSTRHNMQTAQNYVTSELSKEKRHGDLSHIGNSQAILIGDLLFAWALEIFDKNEDFDNDKLKTAKKYLYKMIDDVFLGQLIDVDTATRDDVSLALIDEKITLKTASYSFIRPMQIGASLIGINEKTEKFCYELGLKLGIAFQIQDDLLDIIGDTKNLNKSTFRDISENQHTYFTNYIFQNGTDEQKEKLRKFLGSTLTEEDKQEIRDLFYSSGAISFGEKIIKENFADAVDIVDAMNIKEKDKFYNLITSIETRSD